MDIALAAAPNSAQRGQRRSRPTQVRQETEPSILSARYFPVHPKPCDDELLSSWLRRTAFGNASLLHTFCNVEWPGMQIWNRDIDTLAPAELVDRLALGTATLLERARGTTLHGFEGVLFEERTIGGHTRWLTQTGIWHRKRRRHGLQWCAQCLATDAEPYYRRRWRTALATTCPRHGRLLDDGCYVCGSAAAPHRKRDPLCQDCSADRRLAPQIDADGRVLAFEAHCARVLAGAPVTWPFFLGVHPLAFFGTLHQLLIGLAFGKRAARFRSVAVGNVRMEDFTVPDLGGGKSFEHFRAADRHRLMSVAVRLLDGWPWIFVASAQEAGYWKSWATRDTNPNELPFLYGDAVQRFLYKASDTFQYDVSKRAFAKAARHS